MRFYTTIQQITIPKAIAVKAWQFANAVNSTTDYSDTNQKDLKKIRLDHFVSKLGEEAVYAVLTKFGNITQPDYNIYTAEQKSWNDDLYFETTGIAVKTMLRSAANRFGLSWVFQSGAPRRDIILDKPEAWVFFVECDDTGLHNKLYKLYVYPPYQVKELKFADPVLKKLVGHKLVVYANQLPILPVSDSKYQVPE
ncbi:MAG: hypothetical protein IT249_03540 [Chitinophagaceae bacterium]|nr:hypothetical protein [Chitinophagaceae bacterium]